MELFNQFDRVQYKVGDNHYTLTNILRKATAIKSILKRVDVFYDYVIKEGERADTIAHDYYGSSEYTWLIWIINDIFDPYYQWPLTDKQLFNFIKAKYGDPYAAQSTIDHYKHNDKNYTIAPYTYDNMTLEQRVGWYPVTQWQKEQDANEAKRKIKLISNRFLNQIEQEVKELFN